MRKPDPAACKMEGFHAFRNEDGEEYGSFEVAWLDDPDGQGWYWAACFPGCMPDSDWHGPFLTSRAAWRDARDS